MIEIDKEDADWNELLLPYKKLEKDLEAYDQR
jgi:hypothetical protein